jgi:ABC-2 type transport system permease protein
VTLSEAVLGKFLAAWCIAGLALALTFPMWITVNYLGEPDNGSILAAYAGSLLMAGGFLAIGSCLSAATRNQVIAFIVTAVVCFAFLLSGLPARARRVPRLAAAERWSTRSRRSRS